MRIISTLVFTIGASSSLQGCSVSTEDLNKQAQEILQRKDLHQDERKMLGALIEPVHESTSTSTERRTISRVLRKVYGSQDLTIPSESEVRKILRGKQIDEAQFKIKMNELRSKSDPAMNRAVVMMVELSKAGISN